MSTKKTAAPEKSASPHQDTHPNHHIPHAKNPGGVQPGDEANVPLGGTIYASTPITFNEDRPSIKVKVRNTGDRPIQVGSHFHFFEANRALAFDREAAYGKRLNITFAGMRFHNISGAVQRQVERFVYQLQCASYTPFDKDQSPFDQPFVPRAERMDADLALLATRFQCIRTYSQAGLETLPELARKHGLKLMAGAWVSSDPVATEQEVDALIASANCRLLSATVRRCSAPSSPFDQPFKLRPERMDADLALLATRFECIRTYSMTGLEALPDLARKHGLKVMAGAWVSSDPVATEKEINELIASANANPDVVTSVIVGNEALLRKEVTATQLVKLIQTVKSQIKQPVTYADVWEFWLQHPEIAPAVDFLTIHLLPYWEDDPSGIDQALKHVGDVRQTFGNKFAPKSKP